MASHRINRYLRSRTLDSGARQGNVASGVCVREQCGHGMSRISDLPRHFLQGKQTFLLQLTDITEKEEAVVTTLVCYVKATQQLKRIERAWLSDLSLESSQVFLYLKHFMKRVVPDSPFPNTNHDPQSLLLQSFVHIGGIDLLKRIILYDWLDPGFVRRSQNTMSSTDLNMFLRNKAFIIDILTKLVAFKDSVNTAEKVLEAILEGNPDEFVEYLFMCCAIRMLYSGAVQLLEDIFQFRNTVFMLNNVSFLNSLIQRFTDDQLVHFTRILALTLSDMDLYEDRSSLYAQNRQKRTPGFVNVRDINQEFLMSCPEFLPRLVMLIRSLAYRCIPRYTGLATESENWLTWIDRTLDSLIASDYGTTDDLDLYLPGVSESSHMSNDSLTRQFSLQRCNDINNLVSLCYVLGLFLCGRQRRRVQRRLAELRFAELLRELFDLFLWRCHETHPPVSGRLNPISSCECAPEVAVKIQLLRLIHSFCDHAEWSHRRLLLSYSELQEMKQINAELHPGERVEGLGKIDRNLMCRKEPGLLVRIVQILQSEPPGSTFRFWLARAVESYLRCQSAYCDQVLLIRRGILKHVAETLLENEPSKEVVQSGFDLLAELLKFNETAVRELDRQLGVKKVQQLCVLATSYLVDSNMFLRSLVLTIDHFVKLRPSLHSLAKEKSFLLSQYSSDEAQTTVAYKMFRLLSLHTLTQENVSCLNTGLVVLIYAQRAGKLVSSLRSLKRLDTITERQKVFPSLGVADLVAMKPIMDNLLDLLSFWMDHYLNKDKDCSALEKSSRIVFEEWRAIVSILTNPVSSLEESVKHYL